MNGMGSSKDEAYQNLLQKFEEKKKEGSPLPRPGTYVPLELASFEGVQKYEDIAFLFFEKILDMDYGGVFISDLSSMWDFTFEDTLDPYYEKIKAEYGIDVSDTDGHLLPIFERIHSLKNHTVSS